MEEAYRVCPNLLVLEHGRAVQYGSKYEIFEHPTTVSVAQITGCKNFSSAMLLRSGEVEAPDWGCNLQIMEGIPHNISHVGIRAHHISLTKDPNQVNTFPCWLVRTSETPHRMTLFLKLHSAANNPQDYHLQAEVFKEKWATMKDQPFPWYLRLDPLGLILME
ncbi:molybdate ABC transporter inner membrane subunit [Calothrix sp. NIES-2100]|nr:molybdate ABC transporter inner membrane subunit [Calothrix sp. NIES-2100]